MGSAYFTASSIISSVASSNSGRWVICAPVLSGSRARRSWMLLVRRRRGGPQPKASGTEGRGEGWGPRAAGGTGGDAQVAPLRPRLILRRDTNGHHLLELFQVKVDPRPVQREPFGAQLRHPIGVAMVNPCEGLAEELIDFLALGRFNEHASQPMCASNLQSTVTCIIITECRHHLRRGRHMTRNMHGGQALIRTLVDCGVDTCFMNPGTSEMHFVAALDAVPEMRSVLALFEGVATGAADGYGRMAGRPAATLLHLGPGLGNGLANLHNARAPRTASG